MAACWVSTLDNPYDFFEEFEDWYAFDTQTICEATGEPYNTCAYVDRIASTASGMSQYDQEKAIEWAVDEIVRMNLSGNYIKVYEKERKTEENNNENKNIGEK